MTGLRPFLGSILLALTAACGRRSDYGCGIAAMAGLSLLIEEFGRPGNTLAQAPANLPESLPVRLALGPAFHSVVGRSDTSVVVGVEGTVPPSHQIGFGVLVQSPDGRARGVILYEGSPVQGAPRLGIVNVGGKDVPLIGIRLELGRFERPGCPIFPDSL
jgi:hypothetical protein